MFQFEIPSEVLENVLLWIRMIILMQITREKF